MQAGVVVLLLLSACLGSSATATEFGSLGQRSALWSVTEQAAALSPRYATKRNWRRSLQQEPQPPQQLEPQPQPQPQAQPAQQGPGQEQGEGQGQVPPATPQVAEPGQPAGELPAGEQQARPGQQGLARRRRPTWGTRTCMAEEQCIAHHCGSGYASTALKFPYTVSYQKLVQEQATVFEFQVCTKQCEQGDPHCQPLAAWALRLDNDLVQNAHFLRDVNPLGRLVAKCSETGLGYVWEGDALGPLASSPPWAGPACHNFSLGVAHQPDAGAGFWLTDICQQNIDVVATKNGKTMFAQTSMVLTKDKYSDVGSCLVHFKAANGAYSFTLMEDRQYQETDLRKKEVEVDQANIPLDLVQERRRLL